MTAIYQEQHTTSSLSETRRQTSTSDPLFRAEYLIEATLLALFMISACAVTVVFQGPLLPLAQTIHSEIERRALVGVAMGLTAITLIYSAWGRRSGAHMNPAVTLTFFRLGKIKGRDAASYVVAQFIGALAGVATARIVLGKAVASSTVRYAATYPGDSGAIAAAAAEFLISMLLMTAVLQLSSSASLGKFTGLVAGSLVALYIMIEAPYSGMSMNPARTFGSALPSGIWHGFWIYLLAPLAGMLTAAEIFLRVRGCTAVPCCKLYHDSQKHCIFCSTNGGNHE